jgi:UDP-glucose 4-epimerase
VPPRHTDPRAGDVRNTYADLTAARGALGYEAKVSFEEGLRNTVAWFTGDRAQEVAR